MDVQKLSHQLAAFKSGLQGLVARGKPSEQGGEDKRARPAGAAKMDAAGNEENKKAQDVRAKRIAEQIQEFLKEHNKRLHFYVHEGTRRIAVKVIDNETQEVIREVPLEELLDLAARVEDFAGLLFNERV